MGTRIDNEKITATEHHVRFSGQPLALALVCLVLVILIFTMGAMNLKTLDDSLVELMAKNGLTIISDFNQDVEHVFNQLGAVPPSSSFDFGRGTLIDKDDFSLEEQFLNNLIDFSREIDLLRDAGQLSDSTFRSFVTDERLTLVAFLDDKGHVTFASGFVPEELLKDAAPVIRGAELFKTNIFEGPRTNAEYFFIALRRSPSEGTQILALNDTDLQYQRTRFSIQMALRELGQPANLAYLAIVDPQRQVIGVVGKGFAEDQGRIERVNGLLDNLPGDVIIHKVSSQDQDLLEIAASLRVNDRMSGTVRLGLDMEAPSEILSKSRRNVFLAAGFMMAITVLAVGFIYQIQNRYLQNIQEKDRRIQMAERLSALGQFAAGIAHEIRNPLNAISIAIQRLQRQSPHPLIDVIRDEIARLNDIVEEFLSVAKSRKLELRPHDLNEVLGQIILLAEEEASHKGVLITVHCPRSPVMISMDPHRLKQAFINIIKNSLESIAGSGSVSIQLETRGKQWARLLFSDTGIGLSTSEIQHIFDLGYTTKDKGLGFGLPIAHEIIKGHGGTIHVSSDHSRGTAVEILLPLADK